MCLSFDCMERTLNNNNFGTDLCSPQESYIIVDKSNILFSQSITNFLADNQSKECQYLKIYPKYRRKSEEMCNLFKYIVYYDFNGIEG